MFIIKKFCLKAIKLPWLIDLYFNISPKLFAPQRTKEECQANLKVIANILDSTPLRWRGGKFKLSKLKIIVVHQDKITVYYKNGKLCLAFFIQEL